MANNNSNRAYFLEAAKDKAYTVQEIIEQFSCSMNTARTWVTHPEIERIDGSWPPAYKRRLSAAVPTKSTAAQVTKPGIMQLEIKLPSPDQIEGFFRAVMANEQQFNFTEEFRTAESRTDLDKIESKLKSGLVVTEYYKGLMKKEGM